MTDIFKALSEESRLRILVLLLQDEMCVCEIEECLKMTQSNASRHLTALRQCGILDSYKKAQWTYYKISDEFMKHNKELYDYLVRILNEESTYQSDIEQMRKCKSQEICNCKKM